MLEGFGDFGGLGDFLGGSGGILGEIGDLGGVLEKFEGDLGVFGGIWGCGTAIPQLFTLISFLFCRPQTLGAAVAQ